MTDTKWQKNLDLFFRRLKSLGEKEARRIWREEKQLVFVKRYTVPAHFYAYKPRTKEKTRRRRAQEHTEAISVH